MKRLLALTSVFLMAFIYFSFGAYQAVYATQAHRFGAGETLIETSCLFDGRIRYVCLDCGEITEETIPATGHHLTASEKNTVACPCGYSETKIKKFGKSHQTFVCEKGVLTLKTAESSNGEYIFDFCEASSELAEEYRRFYPGFSKAYLFHLEYAGKPAEMTEEMTLFIPLTTELEDHEMKVAVLHSGKFYYLESFEIKNGEIRIDGGDLIGVEAIFLEKGERITMSVAVPIIVTIVTLILAAGAIYLILFPNLKFFRKTNVAEN